MDDRLVQAAKEAAYNEATTPSLKKLETLVEKVLTNTSQKAIEPIKSHLRNANKQRMRTGQFYLCDSCDEAIHNPQDGFVVHGNIYVADPTCRGGLVGNNFPLVSPGDKIEVGDVQETVLCKKCFIQAMSLEPINRDTKSNASSTTKARDPRRDVKANNPLHHSEPDISYPRPIQGPRPDADNRARPRRRDNRVEGPIPPSDQRAWDAAVDGVAQSSLVERAMGSMGPRVSMESRSSTGYF